VPASYPADATFGGDTVYAGSTGTASFALGKEDTTIAYTGPTVILAGSSSATLTAHLVEDGANDDDADPGSAPPDPAGQSVTLGLGSQSCVGTTDSSGDVSCAISSVSVGLGPEPLTATFTGDAWYRPSSDASQTAIVFAFPSGGAFVLGDATVAAATPATPVTWWSSQWFGANALTGGVAPAAFKGFADGVTTLPTKSPANSCGTTFTSSGGSSPPPAAGVPSYMGVVVAGSATKSGSTIGGTWARIVVVKTDPGYAANSGHPGTGKIVATFCP
jgi:hypothetical protein